MKKKTIHFKKFYPHVLSSFYQRTTYQKSCSVKLILLGQNIRVNLPITEIDDKHFIFRIFMYYVGFLHLQQVMITVSKCCSLNKIKFTMK